MRFFTRFGAIKNMFPYHSTGSLRIIQAVDLTNQENTFFFIGFLATDVVNVELLTFHALIITSNVLKYLCYMDFIPLHGNNFKLQKYL